MKVGIENVQRVKKNLQGLKSKEREILTAEQVVDLLRGEIEQALEKGYSRDEIAALMKEQGVKISPSSLKKYLSAAKPETSTSAGPAAAETGKNLMEEGAS